MLTSSSPAEALGSKKRTRSALKSLNINEGGSPEKKDVSAVVKPPRKVSRASISSAKEDQENHENFIDAEENMLVDA